MARKTLSEQAIDDVREALKSLKNSKQVHELRWANSCLVQQLRTEQPKLTQYEALQRVLTTVRDALAAESPDYAAILQGLFWDKFSRGEMLARFGLKRWRSMRTFDDKQKKALVAFAELLHAHEDACKQTHPSNSHNPNPSDDPPDDSPRTETFIPEPPYHPLSAVTIIVLDGVWGVPEIVATASVVGLPTLPVLMITSGVTAFAIVSLIQRVVVKESRGWAIIKGVVAGVIVGVPYPLIGTPFGAILLGWVGLHKLSSPGKAAFEDEDDLNSPRY